MNTYEILYIISPQLSNEDALSLREKVKKDIQDFKGKLTKEEEWGLRKLAFPIKKEKRGYYVLALFQIDPGQLKKIDQQLKDLQEILRFQIVRTKPIKQKELKKELKKEKPINKKPSKVKLELDQLEEKIDKILEI